MTKRLLSIAGSDSGGGAGVQADIKTASAFGVYAATAITAVTVQNTQGVSAVHTLPPDIVSGQIEAVLSDIGADAIKIGMLATAPICKVVAQSLNDAHCPIVLDPVMVATSGDPLLRSETVDVLKQFLIPMARVITPNLPEFDILCGLENPADDARIEAAKQFVSRKGVALVLKGGHGAGRTVTNLLFTGDAIHRYETERLSTAHTHGTGCTLASAIACCLAKGVALPEAVSIAGEFVHNAILNAPGFGSGHGPLDFFNQDK